MNSHKNALLTPRGREPMVRAVVDGGLSKATVADLYKTSPKTVAKWVRRFRAEGVEGLRDRYSRPLSLPSQTSPATCSVIQALRRQRHTGKQIAAEVGVSPATVSRLPRRLELNRIRDLDPAEPARRYECAAPGEMIHIDIKELGRFQQIGHRITGDRTRQSSRRGSDRQSRPYAIRRHGDVRPPYVSRSKFDADQNLARRFGHVVFTPNGMHT